MQLEANVKIKKRDLKKIINELLVLPGEEIVGSKPGKANYDIDKLADSIVSKLREKGLKNAKKGRGYIGPEVYGKKQHEDVFVYGPYKNDLYAQLKKLYLCEI